MKPDNHGRNYLRWICLLLVVGRPSYYVPCRMRRSTMVFLPRGLWQHCRTPSCISSSSKCETGMNEIPLTSPKAKIKGVFVSPWTNTTSAKLMLVSWSRNPTEVCRSPDSTARNMPKTCFVRPSIIARIARLDDHYYLNWCTMFEPFTEWMTYHFARPQPCKNGSSQLAKIFRER